MTTTAKNYIANSTVPATEHCVGQKWKVIDIDALSELVALIIMAQSIHAKNILRGLSNDAEVYSDDDLKEESISKLTIPEGLTDKQRAGHTSHRDGLLFEAISWITATQNTTQNVLIRDPHVIATQQGLDGLMIELDDNKEIQNVTIFEDKCGEDARSKFRDDILPFFLEVHLNKNRRHLISTANALLEKVYEDTEIPRAAQAIFSHQTRNYRAGLVIEAKQDNEDNRKKIFRNYENVKDLDPSNRIAGTLVIDNDLRAWFQNFAENVISKIEAM